MPSDFHVRRNPSRLILRQELGSRKLAVAFLGPHSGPKAKGNSSPDHECDHSCVPQSHSVSDLSPAIRRRTCGSSPASTGLSYMHPTREHLLLTRKAQARCAIRHKLGIQKCKG